MTPAPTLVNVKADVRMLPSSPGCQCLRGSPFLGMTPAPTLVSVKADVRMLPSSPGMVLFPGRNDPRTDRVSVKADVH